MATSKALTTENIVPILKKAGFVTKDDLDKAISKAVNSSERRIIRRINSGNRDLAQRIANVALNTPTRIEFEELKKEFEKAKSYL